MYLKELIAFLEAADQTLVVPHGFANPHSYRGHYERLAFEPAASVTVASMLACAKGAIGKTFSGYKGGEYTMDEYTACYLANWGSTGSEIGGEFLTLMLNEALISVGRETSLVGELHAKLVKHEAMIKDLRERWTIAEIREQAAHERARKAEEALENTTRKMHQHSFDGVDDRCVCGEVRPWQPPAPSETEVLRAFLLGVARLDPRRLEPEYDGYGTVCYYCERDAGYGENIRHDESWHDPSCLWRRIREDLRARGIVIEQEDGDQK